MPEHSPRDGLAYFLIEETAGTIPCGYALTLAQQFIDRPQALVDALVGAGLLKHLKTGGWKNIYEVVKAARCTCGEVERPHRNATYLDHDSGDRHYFEGSPCHTHQHEWYVTGGFHDGPDPMIHIHCNCSESQWVSSKLPIEVPDA